MCCSTGRQAWGRRRSRTLWPRSLVSRCVRPRGRCWRSRGDLAALLTNLKTHEVLFIDEIHRMSPVIEEILYPAMEDYELDIVIGQGPERAFGQGPAPEVHPGWCDHACWTAHVAAAGALWDCAPPRLLQRDRPPRDRGALRTHPWMCPIDEAATRELARRARGTPRVANRLLRRVRDYAQVRADGSIDVDVAKRALEMLEVDDNGFRRGRPPSAQGDHREVWWWSGRAQQHRRRD